MTQNPHGEPIYPNSPDQPGGASWNAPSGSVPPAPAPYPPSDSYRSAQPNAFERNLGTVGGSDPMTPSQERSWGVLSHLVPAGLFVLSAGTLGFIASLVIYFLYKDRGPFVRRNAANALNVQIMMGIGAVICFLLMATLILIPVGIIGLVAVGVWGVVIHLIAAAKAGKGEWYDPPMTIKFIR